MPIERAWAAQGQSGFEGRRHSRQKGVRQASARGTPPERTIAAGPLKPSASPAAREVVAPFIAVIVVMAMFLPEETSFYLGTIRMTVVRLLFILINSVHLDPLFSDCFFVGLSFRMERRVDAGLGLVDGDLHMPLGGCSTRPGFRRFDCARVLHALFRRAQLSHPTRRGPRDS